VKLAGMVVWVLTAGIGVYLLAAGIAAQRPAGAEAGGAEAGGGGSAAEAGGGGSAAQAAGGGSAAPAGGGSAAVAAAAEGSALLEFTHPLLALTGLTFWIFFVMTDDRLFAWIAFGVVVGAVLAGLSWVIIGRRTARGRGGGPGAAGPGAAGPVASAHAFPGRLVVIHGLAAACTLALVVIAAATAAAHG
jgi:hypothetical protein